MAYQTYYQQMQNQMGQPIMPMQGQPMQNPQIPQQQTGTVWVHGYMAAANYPICPNCAVNLWDDTAPVVYVKSADATGRPNMEIYDLVKRTDQPTQQQAAEYITRAEFDELTAKVDRLIPKSKKKEDTANE